LNNTAHGIKPFINASQPDQMSIKEKIQEHVLKACEEEYKDKLDVFNHLDSKAQQLAGFAGVLLGILITFCKKEVLDYLSSISLMSIWGYMIAIVLLLISIGLSIYSMRLIKIFGMPVFAEFETEIGDLLKLNETDLNGENYLNLINGKIERWKKTFISIEDANRKKGRFVFITQIVFALGLFMLGITPLMILSSYLFA